MDSYVGKSFEIVDLDGKVICSGKCLYQKKIPSDLISFDNKYFFNPHKSSTYKVKQIKSDVSDVSFNKDLYQDLVFCEFSKYPKDINTVDVFIENNEKELDPEVVELVASLNRMFGIETTGSCSGHDSYLPWITFKVYDLFSLSTLKWILQHGKYNDMFILILDGSIQINGVINNHHAYPVVKLQCNQLISQSYKYLLNLSKFIDSLIDSGVVKSK